MSFPLVQVNAHKVNSYLTYYPSLAMFVFDRFY